MIALVENKLVELAVVCRKYPVSRLALCGSALNETFDAKRSDLDFVVEFQPLAPIAHKNAFFGLQAELENLFARPIDLIETDNMRNPFVRESIEQSKETLYAIT